MHNLFDPSAPKKATNLSINSDLLGQARELKVNLSAMLEEALIEVLAKSKAEEWSKENRNAIRSYNEFIDEHGSFGEEYRNF